MFFYFFSCQQIPWEDQNMQCVCPSLGYFMTPCLCLWYIRSYWRCTVYLIKGSQPYCIIIFLNYFNLIILLFDLFVISLNSRLHHPTYKKNDQDASPLFTWHPSPSSKVKSSLFIKQTSTQPKLTNVLYNKTIRQKKVKPNSSSSITGGHADPDAVLSGHRPKTDY